MDCAKYLEDSVHPIIADMVKELIADKPDDPIPLMLHVLETKLGKMVPPLTHKETVELLHLQSRWKSVKEGKTKRSGSQKLPPPIVVSYAKANVDSKFSTINNKNDDSSSDSSSDGESNETFSRDMLLKIKPMANKPGRASVSAEVIGQFNKRADFKKIVIPKDDDTKKRVKRRLGD
jgi:hypothetical protein